MKRKASKFLTVPTRPVPIDRDRSVAGLLEKMEGAGFKQNNSPKPIASGLIC
ncbi:MAG: hypothetical protein IPG22_06105 [Acidobacteria bacterium]|nr:hypothetical protein [Acidobacteriota bacterium]